MSVFKHISGMFASPKKGSQPPPPSEARHSVTHRERLAERGNDDITAQFAHVFQQLDDTVTRGTPAVVEVADALCDESKKLKHRLKTSKAR